MCRAIVTSQESEACDEQNFRKWRCYCFSWGHFELIFSREWSSNVVSLFNEDTIISHSNGKGKCILITTWKFPKKVSEAFWWVSKLAKLCECGAAFRSTKSRFSLDKKHKKTCSFAPKQFVSHRIHIAYNKCQGMNHKNDQCIYSNQFPPL